MADCLARRRLIRLAGRHRRSCRVRVRPAVVCVCVSGLRSRHVIRPACRHRQPNHRSLVRRADFRRCPLIRSTGPCRRAVADDVCVSFRRPDRRQAPHLASCLHSAMHRERAPAHRLFGHQSGRPFHVVASVCVCVAGCHPLNLNHRPPRLIAATCRGTNPADLPSTCDLVCRARVCWCGLQLHRHPSRASDHRQFPGSCRAAGSCPGRAVLRLPPAALPHAGGVPEARLPREHRQAHADLRKSPAEILVTFQIAVIRVGH